MPTSTRRVAASLTLCALLSCGVAACLALGPTARPPGSDCMVVEATFREASGGVGLELYDVAGRRDAAVSWYAACPAAEGVPPTLAGAWMQAWGGRRNVRSVAPPFLAIPERAWTRPYDGVLYRYATYRLFFRGCDFFYNAHGGDPSNPNGPLDFEAACRPPVSALPAT